jgi:Mg2+ and Co2+ transporter CorA
MFLIRHELLTLETMGAQAREVYERMSALTRMIPSEDPPLIADLINRFERVTHVADGEMAFMQGVIDFYQARTSTRMNIAMERLALIAAVVLPVTAIASVYGMNLIVGQRTDVVHSRSSSRSWLWSMARCSHGPSAWAGGSRKPWGELSARGDRPPGGMHSGSCTACCA